MFNSLGKTTTDKLVLLSHSIIGANNLIQNPTFCDGAKAIIQADQQLYAGANKNTIISIMKNRGIGNSPGAIKDLGTLGGTYSFAYGINNSGQVAGFSTTIADGTYHAFIWDAVNGMQDLGTLGGSESQAIGINDSGQVVGHSDDSTDWKYHAFIWRSEEHTSELQSPDHLVCRLLLEKKKKT